MKNTGIIRHIDELGRITLPIELRRALNISEKDPVQVYVEDDKIILTKVEAKDIFDGSTEDLISYKGKKVSRQSILELAKLANLTISE